jgi:hypothetical protein
MSIIINLLAPLYVANDLHFCVDARYLSKGFTNLKIDVDRFTAVDAPFALVVHVEEFMDRDTTVSNSCSLRFYHPNYYVRYAILRLKTQKAVQTNQLKWTI